MGVRRAEFPDRAVIHASNASEFEEIVAALDAIAGVRRDFTRGTVRTTDAAFDVSFAAN
jgi:hypothetical protein